MKKVVIFYASIGSGHYSAAQSIQAALLERGEGWQVVLKDAFSPRTRNSGLTDFISALSSTVLPGVYTRVWQSGSMSGLFHLSTWFPVVRLRIRNIMAEERPDIVVCTHALPCAVLAGSTQRAFALLAVATDYQVHAYWPVRGVDGYAVASQAAAERMQRRGIPADRLRVLGIPVQPVFACLAREQSAPAAQPSRPPRVLVIAGGRRNGPYLAVWPKILRLLRALAARPLAGVEWLLVFGNAGWLRRRAEALLAGRADVRILGLSGQMPEHMHWADLVVTKPGGLTLAEALSLGKPVVLLQRGGGQEAANSEVILRTGAGVLLEDGEQLPDTVERYARDAEWQARLQAGAAALSRPEAAHMTAAWVAELG
jgi:processive 1,2-diacylglycerol beta-glucosyltransferase